MNTPARTHRWIRLFRCQPLTIRLLVATAAVVTAAAAFEAPAEADPIDDTFIDTLNHAGVNFGEPGSAKAMGQSVCPMLAEPGGNFAAAVQRIQGNSGMSPQMANAFTRIAISMYCPTMMANVASGNIPGLPPIPGVPGS
ncbi:hypothetical protein MHAE_13440 [Mycobacterium haemophilum DSM 44634]|uniref:Lipoprotein n=1 Tax=Mycobacterium haemophilum TaxID=29311 RepID=A0A0I9TXY7_9MYCO|nr:DUF732 domain-containing protein [Mycobacterium haemophilum]KLO33683.1 lipoprotein [Mycobacterium haemophilum]KLO39211.1 lipoprotein [Mycobacterium haemophilum]KLO41799.1 lipoprotein [Mycobacterium haemophilum]KLO49829.1 lipoprotein [Mycobacterium haemophilum]MCV7342408.1 DUF732 domain-containing protein [Mycobacterium haemophilum DSM 44634]